MTDRAAFLDDRRVCVISTRAKKMQLIIAGTFDNVDSTTWQRTFGLPNPIGANPREITEELTTPLLYYRNYYQSEKKVFVEVEGSEGKVPFVPNDLKQLHEEDEEELSNEMDTTANGNTGGSWGSVEATDQPPIKWSGDESTDKTSKPTDKTSKPTDKASKSTDKASKSTDKASKSTDKTSKSTEDKTSRTPNCSHR